MTDAEILCRFRENNPFASSASPLPWNNNNPDLTTLNREAEEEIEQLLRDKRRSPFSPMAGLILGEAGAGKTHMLMRLLRRLRDDGQIAIFVTVRTFRDPESVMQHLLSETVISLGRGHSAGKTQLDILMGELAAAHREWLSVEGFAPRDGLDGTIKTLHLQMPDADKGLLKCLLLYAGSMNQETRMELLDWIRSGAGEEDAERLGLPVRDAESQTKAEREDNAERMLLSIGQVLSCAKVPMMVCFDQLDGMESKELINAWGRTLSMLMNDLSGVLPLAFLRADTWNTRFSASLDESVVQRLTPHTVIMRNCTLEQGKQLIIERVVSAFGDGYDEMVKWLMPRLDGKLRSGYSPRLIIELAGKVIEEADRTATQEDTAGHAEASHESSGPKRNGTDSVLASIGAAFREERNKVAMAPQDWPPDAENLLLVLHTWLDARDDFSVSATREKHIRLVGHWTAGGRTVRCAFIVAAPKVHGTARLALRHGVEFLSSFPGSLCCYISDGRAHKGPSRWKVVWQQMLEFQKLGGKALILDNRGCAEWYGLAALINKLDNGDIAVFDSGERRAANRGDLKRYLAEMPSLLFAPGVESIWPLP